MLATPAPVTAVYRRKGFKEAFCHSLTRKWSRLVLAIVMEGLTCFLY